MGACQNHAGVNYRKKFTLTFTPSGVVLGGLGRDVELGFNVASPKSKTGWPTEALQSEVRDAIH